MVTYLMATLVLALTPADVSAVGFSSAISNEHQGLDENNGIFKGIEDFVKSGVIERVVNDNSNDARTNDDVYMQTLADVSAVGFSSAISNEHQGLDENNGIFNGVEDFVKSNFVIERVVNDNSNDATDDDVYMQTPADVSAVGFSSAISNEHQGLDENNGIFKGVEDFVKSIFFERVVNDNSNDATDDDGYMQTHILVVDESTDDTGTTQSTDTVDEVSGAVSDDGSSACKQRLVVVLQSHLLAESYTTCALTDSTTECNQVAA